ncbi:MAG: zinc-ribbon domain-containing protein [Candidatus Hodarchaeota archaeon]
MPEFCSHCGKPVKKGYDFCIECGKPISQEDVVSSKHEESPMIKNEKKESNYILNSAHRKILLRKVFPVLLIGSIIWLCSELIFSYFFSELEITNQFLIFYISMIIVDALLFLVLFFASKANKVFLGLLFFFSFSFIAGILSLPIVIFTEFLPQVHMFVSLSLGANFIVYFIAIVLREKYFSKGYIWAHIILYGFGCLIVEIVFIIIFNIQNYLLTIPVSLAYISVVALTIMFYGAKVVKKREKSPWLLINFKILGILFVALALAVVIVVIVLIIILLAIACGDSSFDIGSISWGGSGRRKKKKN